MSQLSSETIHLSVSLSHFNVDATFLAVISITMKCHILHEAWKMVLQIKSGGAKTCRHIVIP